MLPSASGESQEMVPVVAQFQVARASRPCLESRYFWSPKLTRRIVDSVPSGWKGRSPGHPSDRLIADPKPIIHAALRRSVVKRLYGQVATRWGRGRNHRLT